MKRSQPTAAELLAVITRSDLSPSARLAWMLDLVSVRSGGTLLTHRELAVTLGVGERRARGITLELFETGAIRHTGSRTWFPDVDAPPRQEISDVPIRSASNQGVVR